MISTAFKVGLLFCALAFISTGNVSALSTKQLAITEDPFHYETIKLTDNSTTQKKKVEAEVKPEPKEEQKVEAAAPIIPAPVQYTVVAGDTLTKIAEANQTQWTRLFAKNTQIAQPDTINVGDVITIPTPEEQLAERALPVVAPTVITPQISSGQSSTTSAQPRGSSAGNTYAAGYCTWYAKSRRPDLPNRLGNASAWVSSAAAQGFATGSAPRVGAIGQQGNHVVYIESVNGDGTVTVSEMNWRGLGVVSSRTTSASSFTYIY